MIKALFSLAEKLKPCVIFIDEMDGFFGERSILDQSFIVGLKTQMMTYMDGLINKDSSIVFIGATNRLESIDPAIKRRMRTHLYINLPDQKERISLWKYYLKNHNVDYKRLAENSENLSGSDIHEACKLSYYMNNDLSTEVVIDAINNCL